MVSDMCLLPPFWKCKITVFIPACAPAPKRMYTKRKEVIFIRDLNMNMLESSNISNDPNKDLTEGTLVTRLREQLSVPAHCSALL